MLNWSALKTPRQKYSEGDWTTQQACWRINRGNSAELGHYFNRKPWTLSPIWHGVAADRRKCRLQSCWVEILKRGRGVRVRDLPAPMTKSSNINSKHTRKFKYQLKSRDPASSTHPGPDQAFASNWSEYWQRGYSQAPPRSFSIWSSVIFGPMLDKSSSITRI